MNTLFNTDYNAKPKKAIDTIQSTILDTDKQIDKLNFIKDCMIDKLIVEISNINTYPFVYKPKFYSAIIAYLNRKETPLPKTKEERKAKFENDPKDCYKILLEDIQNIFPSVTKINQIIWCGFNSYGVDIYFDIADEHFNDRGNEWENSHTYYLYIPIINNISRNNIVWDNNYIDYDIAKFQLFKQTSTSTWTRIYSSYDLTKELIADALK